MTRKSFRVIVPDTVLQHEFLGQLQSNRSRLGLLFIEQGVEGDRFFIRCQAPERSLDELDKVVDSFARDKKLFKKPLPENIKPPAE